MSPRDLAARQRLIAESEKAANAFRRQAARERSKEKRAAFITAANTYARNAAAWRAEVAKGDRNG